jgi:hypothetical protein
MSYLDRLKAKIGENAPPDQPLKPLEPSFRGFGGDRPRSISEAHARATLRHWHGRLRVLDPLAPPNGLSLGRWGDLCDDAWWLYETWASQLIRGAWSAHDVFGVLIPRDKGGVLLDRLKGARNLKLDGEGRAFWSSFGVTFSTCRGAAESQMSSGLVLIWELQQ